MTGIPLLLITLVIKLKPLHNGYLSLQNKTVQANYGSEIAVPLGFSQRLHRIAAILRAMANINNIHKLQFC
jgi:hypothetical protein